MQPDITTAHYTSPCYGSAGRLSNCLGAEEGHLIGGVVDWRNHSETVVAVDLSGVTIISQ